MSKEDKKQTHAGEAQEVAMNGCDRFMTPYAELPPQEQAVIDAAKALIAREVAEYVERTRQR